MAKARAIVQRRKAVRNIHKITRTMQLIATARYQKCYQRAVASKPYTAKITEMAQAVVETNAVRELLRALEEQAGDGTPGAASAESDLTGRVLRLLKPNEGVGQSVLLTITSNRGLCGAYNASVLRSVVEHRERLLADGITPALEMVGKKGANYMRFLGHELAETITDIEDRIAYGRVAAMAERYMKLYEDHAVARVDVAYMRFHSVGVQRPTVVQLLPIEPPEATEAEAHRVRPDFEFSPPPAVLLARLIPETVKVRLFQYFNDAIVSEQVARMLAMRAATDAAGDMIKYLTRQYNRARQTQITLELADIVGGAEAVR
ncbi:MAG TPA: ATP synthase F1 subunit gamma [Phycisphaerae bacterium]|nr:ATP synthase F1 subunit gamma [Phycisphaerae bacterium]